MIIKSIHLKEGMFNRFIEFSEKANLIHSKQNSKGKTTLLRFLLYSLGYNIPNTRKIKFGQCEVETVIFLEKKGNVILSRTASNNIVLTTVDARTTFVLPEQQNELHAILFETDNSDILRNLLGAFYIDQEKGWTLLNRGVAIGSIHFNIEELIRGLSGRDCTQLIQKEMKLSRELGKYKQIFSISQYQETIETEQGSLAVEHHDEKIDSELELLKIRQSTLKKELRRLDRAIKDNNLFRKFIADMKLLVKGMDGINIPVTAENIVGFNDSVEYLITKHKLISAELASVVNNITVLENQRQTDADQLSFWESESIAQSFDRRIASLQINAIAISNEIKKLEKELKNVRQSISDCTKMNNDVVNNLYKIVLKYSVELGIGTDTTMPSTYLFTSNLRELSGALLHKTVFAFRLAYIIEIERIIGVKLPIIMDSPRGKEVDVENVKLMTNILKRDFSDHQIIIASIFEYDFAPINKIEIVNQLIEVV